VPFFCQAGGDLYEALPQPAVQQNFLLYIIQVDHLQLPNGTIEQPKTNSEKGRCNLTTLGEDTLMPIKLRVKAEAQAWHLNWRR